MSPLLFDPLAPPMEAWPSGALLERAFIEEVARQGPAAMVANVRTRWLALRSGERLFPLTVNDGETGDSYVCLPHTAYVLYGKVELDLVDIGPLAPLFRLLIGLAGRGLLATGLNRIVNLDNWLLSTNLHGGWNGEDLPEIRTLLQRCFPGHIIAMRSLDGWSSPELLEAARRDGWQLVPSRQVWVTDDLPRQWRTRDSTKRDFRVLRRSGLIIEEPAELSEADAIRIAELYDQLYVGKYSALNPIFTPTFIAMTHRHGMLRYRIARAPSGVIQAVAGVWLRDGVLTSPIVGYDTSRPQKEGLYRIACCLCSEMAQENGARLHSSAGAGYFKRTRGAHGEIEYWAMHVAHLPLGRRLAVAALRLLLERLAVPMMKRRGL
ncbi:MAG TPA: hypothetical protein VKP60_21725 [Magnetospirillaceae bacterium]|nr:hypothetical protein [Magnetospirillaceae bacterium]